MSHGDDDNTSPETRRLIDDEIKRILKVHHVMPADTRLSVIKQRPMGVG